MQVPSEQKQHPSGAHRSLPVSSLSWRAWSIQSWQQNKCFTGFCKSGCCECHLTHNSPLNFDPTLATSLYCVNNCQKWVKRSELSCESNDVRDNHFAKPCSTPALHFLIQGNIHFIAGFVMVKTSEPDNCGPDKTLWWTKLCLEIKNDFFCNFSWCSTSQGPPCVNSLGTVGFVTHEHFLPSRADCAVHLGVTIETYVTMEISRFMSMGSLDWS